MERFLDLNSSPNHPFEHFEESLNQTMLDHDIIFKKQVHELQGLYAVQKSLMKSDDAKNTRRCETFPMKRSFKGNHSARIFIDKLFSQEDDDDLNGVDLNLSLTIGKSTCKRRKSWKNKIVYTSSVEIIDLEESSGIIIGSSEDAQPVFSLDQLSQNSSDHIKKNPSHGMVDSFVNGVNLHKDPLKADASCSKRETLMNDVMHQEWSSSNQGSNELHDVKQTKLMDFDLNEDQPDESFQSNEPSSDLTEEKEIIISKVVEENPKKDSDLAIKKAAHSLVSISLQQISTGNQDSESKSGSNETEFKSENRNTNPRRSSSIDSYESLVLKLEDNNVDEDCVTSKAFDVIETRENEKTGIKLKRGRRLKDFQKDILPTLSSLSRHEIWEDITILEGVIKSREYKRLQKAKSGNGETWSTPVKSKRSKVNNVGQKGCLRKKK